LPAFRLLCCPHDKRPSSVFSLRFLNVLRTALLEVCLAKPNVGLSKVSACHIGNLWEEETSTLDIGRARKRPHPETRAHHLPTV